MTSEQFRLTPLSISLLVFPLSAGEESRHLNINGNDKNCARKYRTGQLSKKKKKKTGKFANVNKFRFEREWTNFILKAVQ